LTQNRDDTAQNWNNWLHEATLVAALLPDLLVEASAIAQNVTPGWHGRRRAGPGESFWQYRRFADGDLPGRIDWRRSARDDHLYVREQEWEAAHTVWLWADRAPTMRFCSDLAPATKERHALVMALALADTLIRGGERIAVPGLTRPATGPRTPRLIAEAMARDTGSETDAGTGRDGLPPGGQLSAHSDYVMLSDFLAPLDRLDARIGAIASQGVRCHLVQIFDPVEESFPFAGRIEFLPSSGQQRLLVGRAESLRDTYRRKLAEHRDGLRDIARRLGGSFILHHTDQPPHRTLLALQGMLNAPRDFAGAPGRGNAAAEQPPAEAPRLVGESGT
jgi:uncharacterized protein (DUF58 family)